MLFLLCYTHYGDYMLMRINIIINSKIGYVDLYDSKLKIVAGNFKRNIDIEDIDDVSKGNKSIKLICDKENIIIETDSINLLYDFICLQRGNKSKINYFSTFNHLLKYSLPCFFLCFIILFFISGFSFFNFFLSILCLLISGGIVSLSANKLEKTVAICPCCKNEIRLNTKVAGIEYDVSLNDVEKCTCSECYKPLGIKYNNLYEITRENEHLFNINNKKSG